MRLYLQWVAVAIAMWGCADEVDRQAKKRIFSPEDPPKAVASASEKLPPQQAAENAAVAHRILMMGAAETTERIGPHRYTANVTFEWSQGGRTVRLVENRTVVSGAGGVSGDFHAKLENARDQGLEVMRVAGQVYAKNRYGKFRQRLRDRGMAEREREEVYGAIRDVDALFQGRLKLSPQGSTSHHGRAAWRYAVSLGPDSTSPVPQALPPPQYAKDGADPTTQLRLAFYEKREPQTLQGELWVDSETSVVLKSRLDGRLAVPGDKGQSTLRLVVETNLVDVGKPPLLKTPTQFLPDEDKPNGIAAALERFGYATGRAAEAEATPEPEDEGEEPPESGP